MTHRAEQYRCSLPGAEAVALLSDRSFPRHAHDQFGIGIIEHGGHRSWSGIGPVEASAGDVIAVNPGEMHDGSPVQGQVRGWRMLYFEPALVEGLLRDDIGGTTEITRPVLPDATLARRLARLFECMTGPDQEALAAEQEALRTLAHVMSRYADRRLAVRGPPPCVARALQRLDEAPDRPVTLAELAGLSDVSRFQLLRGFRRAVGSTPHAYLRQQRVRLARRLLAAGTPPAEAAAASGFADQSHLTRAFRQQLGVTPARYRAAVA